MHTPPFSNRSEAGSQLTELLSDFRDRYDAAVHALPRGGVPVGYEIAVDLNLPLDVIVVRKIGAPRNDELAMGAAASGGITVRNDEVISDLSIEDAEFDRRARDEHNEVREREHRFRGYRPSLPIKGRTAIVVDDGIATGTTMRAALQVVREQEPTQIVVAVPVAPIGTVEMLHEIADLAVCLATPDPYRSVGSHYDQFPQVQDEDVRRLLDDAETYIRPGSGT
ncbi:MAG: phosphoribosyltransferase [Deltaproteobacteria bacterium]|nr:phosphoribosyltransferase [Deltaproteobacteria bacterium]